jgi:Ran GTPase-activating protein (RanGAP) involved in mRNA processing and transport
LEILDLLDNEIGLLGCSFLSKILHPGCGSKLMKLKLDHNNIGTEGLAILTSGLAQNDTIEKLSLNYCGITADGAKYLQEILSSITSKLFKLKIMGNLLKNEGTYELFRALEVNTTLEKLKMSDN